MDTISNITGLHVFFKATKIPLTIILIFIQVKIKKKSFSNKKAQVLPFNRHLALS